MKKLLLLDLDFTLFKTDEYWVDFATAVAIVTNQPASTYVQQYNAYVVGEGRLRLIDYERFLADTGADHDAVAQQVRKIAINKSYLYDDAKQLLHLLPRVYDDYELAILSFGEPEFQSLKISLVPEIADFAAYITQELKTEYIAKNFSDRQGVLVDDKPGQELPDGWLEVTIDRTLVPSVPPVKESASVYRIASLQDVVSVVSQ